MLATLKRLVQRLFDPPPPPDLITFTTHDGTPLIELHLTYEMILVVCGARDQTRKQMLATMERHISQCPSCSKKYFCEVRALNLLQQSQADVSSN
jgi:hypothetical protein